MHQYHQNIIKNPSNITWSYQVPKIFVSNFLNDVPVSTGWLLHQAAAADPPADTEAEGGEGEAEAESTKPDAPLTPEEVGISGWSRNGRFRRLMKLGGESEKDFPWFSEDETRKFPPNFSENDGELFRRNFW